ncbi:MAG: hypothetical protein ACREB8_02080 [Pseudolabrys sp.]
MPRNRTFLAVPALVLAISAGLMLPAAAEFFGCNDNKASHAYSSYASANESSRYTHEFAAQSRPRIVIHPRHKVLTRYSKRHCESWLSQEDRLSGPVLTPQMRCWWD